MNAKRNPRRLILSAAGPASAALVVSVFAGYATFGANGLLARGGYQHQIEVRKTELASLQEEQARLANRKRLLAQGDPDLADELTRRDTDMIGNDEVVVLER